MILPCEQHSSKLGTALLLVIWALERSGEGGEAKQPPHKLRESVGNYCWSLLDSHKITHGLNLKDHLIPNPCHGLGYLLLEGKKTLKTQVLT